ncbi:MAG: hypothetical protein COA74_05050 [Gammaproteobacteria bacterium]|nr:MAG: hypothetical protein COA74_05050 [Gammaproteobacteria bacterium]
MNKEIVNKEIMDTSALDDIPLALPALTRAQKLQSHAANEGFDWRHVNSVFDKLNEEILELKQAISNNNKHEIEDEMGDCLFTLVNLARHLDVDADSCLRLGASKFERRFRLVEMHHQQNNQKISDSSDEELEALWQQIKTEVVKK